MSTKVQEDIKLKLKQPKRYGVYLLNDDFTTFDFVKLVLKEIFDKNGRTAEDIAMKIHTDKIALAGIYSKEVAEYELLRPKGRSFLAKCHTTAVRSG